MTSPSAYGSSPTITVDGTPLAPEVTPALVRTIVDTQLHLPDMFVMQFRDTERDVLSRARIDFGSLIIIAVTADGDGTPNPVIIGEVTALEQDTDSTGTTTIVRGYDMAHRLCRGRKTRTFNYSTDAMIVAQVALEAGVPVGALMDDGSVHEHVTQNNLSDWEFLRFRANQAGKEVAISNGLLEWREPTSHNLAPMGPAQLFTPSMPSQLLLGRELIRFRPRVTAAEQVGQVLVRGWDPQTKQAVTGSAQVESTSASVGVTPSDLASKFSATDFVVVDRPVSMQMQADGIAASVADQIASAHAEAEGLAYGDPNLKPGAAVAIGSVGWPHDGSYVLTSARHVYDERGYVTEFAISGAQERSLYGLASGGATKGHARASGPPIAGLVIGQVTDVNDPMMLFRVKVALPWLADDYESTWCRVAQPGAGDQRGLIWLPEVGDEVLIGFDHGDVEVPYVIGGLFNGVDRPPQAATLVDPSSGEVNTRAMVSRTSHRVVLSDSMTQSQVLISTGDDNMQITLDQTGTAISIDASGKVTISGSTGVEITSNADVKLTASGKLSLSGSSGVDIDGGPQVKVSGGVIKLN